jgi:hypothetical protein
MLVQHSQLSANPGLPVIWWNYASCLPFETLAINFCSRSSRCFESPFPSGNFQGIFHDYLGINSTALPTDLKQSGFPADNLFLYIIYSFDYPAFM